MKNKYSRLLLLSTALASACSSTFAYYYDDEPAEFARRYDNRAHFQQPVEKAIKKTSSWVIEVGGGAARIPSISILKYIVVEGDVPNTSFETKGLLNTLIGYQSDRLFFGLELGYLHADSTVEISTTDKIRSEWRELMSITDVASASGSVKINDALYLGLTNKAYFINNEAIRLGLVTKLGISVIRGNMSGQAHYNNGSTDAIDRDFKLPCPRVDLGLALELPLSQNVSLAFQAAGTIPIPFVYGTAAIKFNF